MPLRHGLRLRTQRGQSLTALAVYTVLWVVLIGRDAVADPDGTCACIGRGDPGLFTWALGWWPHAIEEGINPLFTSAIWNPAEINLAATTSVPGLSIPLWPVTEAFGLLVSYNLATLVSAVLSAWFAYRLCRYVTGAWLPSLVGGYVFGFSSYELGQTIGHLQLVPSFLVPAGVHLVLLRLDEAVSVRRFVALLAAIFGLQALLSTEVLFASLCFGFTVLLVAFWLVPLRRRAIRRIVGPIFMAGGLAVLVLSPFLYQGLRGLGNPSIDWPATARVFSADPLNYVIPTPITWIGGAWTETLSSKFNTQDGGVTGVVSESGAYIGLPLLALCAWFLYRNWKRPWSRVALAVIALIFVASLGAHLHVAEPPSRPGLDYHPTIPLPWVAFARLPVFDHLLPVRFSLFVFLIVAVLVAQALTLPGRGAWARWALAAVGLVALLPTLSGSYWSGKATATPFFDDGTYKRYIKRDEIVLAFPLISGDSMSWQANSDFYFRMASGYISAELPKDFFNDPVVHNMRSPDGTGPIAPENLPAAVRDFLDRHQVGVVLLVPGSAGVWWETVLDRMSLRKALVGGVLLYRVERRLPYTAWGPEFVAVQLTPDSSVRWMVDPEASVPLVNPLRFPRAVTLRVKLVRRGPSVPVTFEYPDGTSQELRVGEEVVTVSRRLTLAPGDNELRLRVDGPEFFRSPDPRGHYLELGDFELVP